MLVLEDDPYGEIFFTGEPPAPALRASSDRVVYLGSFSKTIAPGIRVGWTVAPRNLMPLLLMAQRRYRYSQQPSHDAHRVPCRHRFPRRPRGRHPVHVSVPPRRPVCRASCPDARIGPHFLSGWRFLHLVRASRRAISGRASSVRRCYWGRIPARFVVLPDLAPQIERPAIELFLAGDRPLAGRRQPPGAKPQHSSSIDWAIRAGPHAPGGISTRSGCSPGNPRAGPCRQGHRQLNQHADTDKRGAESLDKLDCRVHRASGGQADHRR